MEIKFEELVAKVVEKLKADKLITQEAIDAAKTEEGKGAVDLGELSKTVTADVWEKIKTELEVLKAEEIAKAERATQAAELTKQNEAKKKEEPKGAPAIVEGMNKTKGWSEENKLIYETLKKKGAEIDVEMEINDGDMENIQRVKADANSLDSAAGRGAEWLRIGFMSGVYSQLGETGVGETLSKFQSVTTDLIAPKLAQLIPSTSVEIIKTNEDQSTAVKDITPTKETSANKTFDIVEIVGKTHLYNNTIEDAGVNIIQRSREALATACAEARMKALVNGDDSATHMDTDTAALGANVPEKGWKGLRKLAIAGGLTKDMNASGGVTLAKLDLLPPNMGKYSTQKAAGTFWLCSDQIWHDLRALADFKTANKASQRYMTLVKGVLEGYMGYPIIPSSIVRSDVSVTGVNTSTGNTFTTMLLVNPQHFLFVVRRKLQVQIVNDPLNGRRVLIATQRLTFGPKKAPSSTIKSLTLGVDLV